MAWQDMGKCRFWSHFWPTVCIVSVRPSLRKTKTNSEPLGRHLVTRLVITVTRRFCPRTLTCSEGRWFLQLAGWTGLITFKGDWQPRPAGGFCVGPQLFPQCSSNPGTGLRKISLSWLPVAGQELASPVCFCLASAMESMPSGFPSESVSVRGGLG